jgi:aminoglycoside 6'-N-acetyltransferase
VTDACPTLAGPRVVIRPGDEADLDALRAILAEPSVAAWWGEPEAREELLVKLRAETDAVLLVIEADGEVAGGIEYWEEADPMYRHAGIDIYLSERFQGRGLGTEAIRLLARYLFDARGHHRLTIDPAVDNERAIRAYEQAGFRAVGVMRQYELRGDGRFHDGLLMDMLRGELRD